MQSKDIILQVIETADGYAIQRTDEIVNRYNSGDWWSRREGWYYKAYRTTFMFKWRAISKAKRLEAELNRARREAEYRQNFVEKKVWR